MDTQTKDRLTRRDELEREKHNLIEELTQKRNWLSKHDQDCDKVKTINAILYYLENGNLCKIKGL